MEEQTKPQSENKLMVPLAIVMAGALIAGAIYMGGGKGSSVASTDNEPQATGEIDIPAVTDKDHVLGSRSAKVMIVEYSDTECPFCKNFHYTMKDVLSAYGNDVAWTYRHLPIAQLHSKASKEAEATECAAEQGGNQAFWNYLDKIFATTGSNDTLDPAELPKMASDIGLNVTDFNACLSSGKYTEAITKSVEGGYKAGARGTPYSVIITKDGTKTIINGAEPLAMVKSKIDALLK